MLEHNLGRRLSGLLMMLGTACSTAPELAYEQDQEALVADSEAHYEVPVVPSLTSFASYPVMKVKWEAKKGVRRLEYDLPEDLTGAKNKIELTGPDVGADWVLEGEAGMATCSELDAQISCSESLPGASVDLSAVEARVNQGQLAPQKLAVSKVFNGDPLGILRFPSAAARD